MSDVSQILNAIEAGDLEAAGRLFPLVYDELRRMAAGHMAQESPGQTLEATALVHEAYLRLVDPPNQHHFANRRHLFGAAAEAMRRILVDRARARRMAFTAGGVGPGPPRSALGGAAVANRARASLSGQKNAE